MTGPQITVRSVVLLMGPRLPELTEAQQTRTAAEHKLVAYNNKMVTLFVERNTHQIDSPERTAVVERIVALWWSEGN